MISKKALALACLSGTMILGHAASAHAIWPFDQIFGYRCCPNPGVGYAPAYGAGTTTSFYGPTGGYAYNPFAPLVPDPRCGSCQTSFYNPCGISPCGVGGCPIGGCATGNCAVSTNQPLSPTPDEPPTTYETDGYDEEAPPADDPGFRDDFDGGDGSFPEVDGQSFKVPTELEDGEGADIPMNKTPPVNVKEDDEDETGTNPTLEAPTPQSLSAPGLIDPRNSARAEPIRKLENTITWRKAPVVVRSRPVVNTSRPLVVRRTVRAIPESADAPLLTRSTNDK